MVRYWKSVLLLALVAFMCTSSAFAASVHFKGGKNSSPKSTDLGTVLQTCVSIAGLGYGDVTIQISAVGLAEGDCINPGGQFVPGQNKVPITASGTETISADEIKNGNVTACVTTEPVEELDPIEAGCPGANWSVPVTDVEFSSVTVTVYQFGEVVLQKTFSL